MYTCASSCTNTVYLYSQPAVHVYPACYNIVLACTCGAIYTMFYVYVSHTLSFMQLDDFYAELKWEFHTWGESIKNF